MDKQTKIWFKSLMNDSFKEKERKHLLLNPSVEAKMRNQWNSRNESCLRSNLGDRIWNRIMNQISGKFTHRMWLNRISLVAASILFLLSIGTTFYMLQNDRKEYIYVMASGDQCVREVLLPDGTIVKMGPNSQLTYPQNFTGGTRDVELIGQAFFDVAKKTGKPFIVHGTDISVTALGTAFEVFNYGYEERAETILLNGKVKIKVEGKRQEADRKVVLNPNEMFVYDKQNESIKVKPVKADNYLSWRNGTLNFENESLKVIISRLEPWFGEKINCPKSIAKKYRFTFKVRGESLETILKLLCSSSPLRYVKGENSYDLDVK